eukprot:8264641-Pyramimonas_sp.AAC.1
MQRRGEGMPQLTITHVLQARATLKSGAPPGEDGIAAEMIKMLGVACVYAVCERFQYRMANPRVSERCTLGNL